MVKRLSKKDYQRIFQLPAWVPTLYAGLAICLIPWIIIISYQLPTRHVATHWDLAWAGFDVALLISLSLTAFFGFRRSVWMPFAATSTATLLVVDAWFDVLTSRSGHQMSSALSTALLVELPLADLSFWLAVRAGRELTRHIG